MKGIDMKKTSLLLGALGLVMTGIVTAQTSTLGRVEPVNEVYGNQVISSDNQKVGNLNNLIIDLESGRILYATVASSKGRVGVPPQVFSQTPTSKDKTVRANVAKAKIDSAPQFGNWDKPEELGQAQYISQVYQHFGQSPWWQGSTPADQGSFHNVHKASETVGMNVLNVNNANIGKVQNVAVDLPSGRVAYVILNSGGNLYALPPDAFTLSSDHKNLVSNIDQAKLAGAPKFDKNSWAKLSDPSYGSQVYQYYGKQAYFQGGNMQPTGR